jgi:hypothetical protein
MRNLHLSEAEREAMTTVLAHLMTIYGVFLDIQFARCACCDRLMVRVTLANGDDIEATLFPSYSEILGAEYLNRGNGI